MEKMKKSKSRRLFGMSVGELCTVAGLLVGLMGSAFGYVVYIVSHFDEKFASMDQKFMIRFDSVEHRLVKVEKRLDKVEERLDGIEVDVKKTSSLLNNYLTWRFLYLHDPTRKNIEPRYDPNEKTLEFYNKDAKKGK